MTDDETLQLADRLFRAIEAADLDAVGDCYDDDIVVWGNIDDREMDKARSLRVLGWLVSKLAEPSLRGPPSRRDPRGLPAGARAPRHRT